MRNHCRTALVLVAIAATVSSFGPVSHKLSQVTHEGGRGGAGERAGGRRTRGAGIRAARDAPRRHGLKDTDPRTTWWIVTKFSLSSLTPAFHLTSRRPTSSPPAPRPAQSTSQASPKSARFLSAAVSTRAGSNGGVTMVAAPPAPAPAVAATGFTVMKKNIKQADPVPQSGIDQVSVCV